MCLNEQISGAAKLVREWVISTDTERPQDGRITTGEYRNWRKKEG